MRLVSRQLKADIDFSNVLQRQLLQEPDTKAFHRAPTETKLLSPKNFKIKEFCDPDDSEYNDILSHAENAHQIVEVTVEGSVPQFGAVWMNMLICQPPITEMTISASCCSDRCRSKYYTPDTPIPSIANLVEPSGIRIKHIVTRARQLMDEHSLCPNAGPSDLREDGIVMVDLVFGASVSLRKGDPMLAARRFQEEGNKRPSRWKTRTHDYCMHKKRRESLPWLRPNPRQIAAICHDLANADYSGRAR